MAGMRHRLVCTQPLDSDQDVTDVEKAGQKPAFLFKAFAHRKLFGTVVENLFLLREHASDFE